MKIGLKLLFLLVVAAFTSAIAGGAQAAHRGTAAGTRDVQRPELRIERLGAHRFAVTTTLPMWDDPYPWSTDSSQGYVGWHHNTNELGAWGFASNLGGNPGLWLYPIGGERYSGEAEFTYTAPGTTRLVSASLDIAYLNKMLAHHCLNIGLRSGAQIIDSNVRCNPSDVREFADPFHVDLADPSGTATELFFQLAIPPCQVDTCDKYIPSLDPLKNGGYARLKSVRMVLVDDDTPQVSLAGELTDQVYISGTKSYGLTVNGSDAGAGISRAWAELGNGTRIADGGAPCDLAHNTVDLDSRICPQAFSFDATVDTNPFPEGRNDLVGKAVDPAGNIGTSDAFTVLVDRTGPTAPSSIEVWNYDAGSQTATIGWDAGTDPDLPTGEPGSGVSRGEYRYQVNGGGWGEWTATDPPDSDTFTNAFDLSAQVGDQIDVEARQWDDVDNASDVGSAQVVITGDEHYDDFGAPQEDGEPDEGTEDNGLRDPSAPSQPPAITDDDFNFYGYQYGDPIFTSSPLASTAVRSESRSILFSRTAIAAATVPDFCTGTPTHGSNGPVSWDIYPNCAVFTNAGGDQWAISKKCINNPINDPNGTEADQRRDVGPGYIAWLKDKEGDILVNDYRVRVRGNTDHGDADANNIGNVGATNGGLGNFELQYARGTPGSLPAGTKDYATNPPTTFTASTAGRPPRGQWPPDGILSGRACASKYANYGVAGVPRFTGPWKVGSDSVGYRAEVRFRDPDTAASPTDATALLKVTYLYRFTPTRVLALNILRVNKDQPSSRGSQMAKEPKWGASVRANGMFNAIDVIDSQGKLVYRAVKGQRETRYGVLYTRQAGKSDRTRVRWSCTKPVCGASAGGPCPQVCFNVKMGSQDASTLQQKNPFDQQSAQPWMSSVTHPRGLDGWAIRTDTEHRAKAYANDTSGDNIVSTCSALDKNGNPLPGIGHKPPFTDAELRTLSARSTLATPRQSTARRWELAGWKEQVAPIKQGDPIPDFEQFAFTGSAVLFNGWEGARGPYDCEPLMRQFPATTQTYVNRAEYWVQH
jgi:hypothetical protein